MMSPMSYVGGNNFKPSLNAPFEQLFFFRNPTTVGVGECSHTVRDPCDPTAVVTMVTNQSRVVSKHNNKQFRE